MKTLEKDQLMEYIRHAIELESSMIGEQTLIDEYTADMGKRKPVLSENTHAEEDVQKQVQLDELPSVDIAAYAVLAAAFLMLFIPLIAKLPFIPIFFMIPAIGMIIPVIYIVRVMRKRKAITEENEEKKKQCREECERIREERSRNREVHSKLLEEWQTSFDSNTSYRARRQAELSGVLTEYYAADVIFPKYRNLPALTSIYEYLMTGRCEELTGPNGAYNLYEMELRQNTVIAQLNAIITNLEQIRQNQFMLYQELTKLNETTSRISADISAIRGYTVALTELSSLNAYYSAVTAESTSALAFMHALG